MRIGQGNIDIAAAIAPRPLGLTAADDWTIELETKGYPDLVRLYEMLGHPDRLTAVFHTQFKHNYNDVNRAVMYSFFNRHFRLGLPEPIVEQDFVPLSRAEATVWTDRHPAPAGDQIGDAHETRLLRMANKDSEQKMEQLAPQSADDLAAYREIVGGGWEVILGRRLAQVGAITFTESGRSEQDGAVTTVGRLGHADQGEQLPVLRIEPAKKSRGTVVYVTDSGKAGLLDSTGRLLESAQQLSSAGYTILAADLFGQGEFESQDQPSSSQRMWYQRSGEDGWQRFSGYTFGYNHCLFAQRVHDILSLLKHANDTADEEVHLVGVGRVAGPLVVAARSQTGESSVANTIADLKGFRFEQLSKHDDPMFVPGSVKYLDVDGLISLCAPAKLTLVGPAESVVAQKVYRAAAASDQLGYLKSTADALGEFK